MKTKEESEYLVNEFVNFLCYSGVNYQLYRNKHEKVSKSPRRLCKFVAEPNLVYFAYICPADQYLVPGWPQYRFR